MLQIDYERLSVYNLQIITGWEERGETKKGKFKLWKQFSTKEYIFCKHVVR